VFRGPRPLPRVLDSGGFEVTRLGLQNGGSRGRKQKTDSSQRRCGHPPLESPGRTIPTNFATRHRLVIPSLTLLPGHGIKSSRFLLNVLATTLGAFRVYFVFLQGENYFEGFVTIVANVVVHGHRGLPLDCDHELRLEL
jgi:hypothetical protein